MQFAILGPLLVHAPDGPVEIKAPKHRALLAMLLLSHREAAVTADRLIDALWGEDPPATANKALQVHVSQLRRALGPANPIVTLPAGYAVRLEPGDLDLERFETLVARARDAAPEQATEELREALALFRGPPLADAPLLGTASPSRPTASPPRGSARSSSGSSTTSRSAGIPRSSPSSRRWPPSTPTASACTGTSR